MSLKDAFYAPRIEELKKFKRVEVKISIKNIIFSILLILLVIFASKVSRLKRYIVEERYYERLVHMHLLNHCYNAARDFISIMDQLGFDYYKLNNTVIKNSLDSFLSKIIEEKDPFKIPLITHHVYFTYDKNPRAINAAILRNLEATIARLNDSGKQWQHYIWTNKLEVFPDNLLKLKGVRIKDIDEFESHPLYNILQNMINKSSASSAYFARASDMFRLMLVQKFGGIYSDLDYEIYNAGIMLHLMKGFDFIGGRETLNERSYYGNAFIAAKPNHPILNDAITKLIDNKGDFSNSLTYSKYPCNLFDRVHFNGPVLITAAYFGKNNIEGNLDIILPPWIIYNVGFARYKNGGCGYASIKDGDLDKLIADFTKSVEASPRIEMLGIYYNNEERAKFPVIGADMFCASWYKYNN